MQSFVSVEKFDNAAEVNVITNEINITDDEGVIEDVTSNLAEVASSGTAVPFDNPIIEMYTADVPRKQLKKFEALPDFFSKFAVPIPFAIPRGDIYLVVSRFDIVEKVTHPDTNVRVMVNVLPDNTDLSIAFEKWGFMDRALGGGVSAAERIWITAHFPPLMAKDPNIKNILSGPGGSRKGQKYNEGTFLTNLIATRLKQPRSVAQKYIYYGKYIDIETLKILAEKKLERQFFESINAKKTGLIQSLRDNTDANKTEQVSKNVLVWFDQYMAEKAARAAKAEAKKLADRVARAAKAKEMKQAGGKKVANAEAPEENNHQQSPSTINGEETFFETLEDEADDTGILTNENLSAQAESLPNSLYGFLPEPLKTSAAIFIELSEFGTKLTELSVKRPQTQELCQELRAILGGLNRILTVLAEGQDTATAVTLADAA